MRKTGRVTLSVLAGATLWAVLWNAGTLGAQAALPSILQPQQPITHVGILLAFIAYSVALSVLAGFTTAALAAEYRATAVRILAGLQMTLGLVFEVLFWNITPFWYHVVFLALVVPATMYGGTLRASRRVRVVQAAI
jgi:hypothetical protein